MKRVQSFYLYSYRMVGFVFLIGLISSILWYGFSMLFFISNTSWSVPMILSPNQEKVMTHLEHVLALEHEVAKNMAQLSSTQESINHKKTQLQSTEKLQIRVEQSMALQSDLYSQNGKIFDKLSKEKTASVSTLKQLAAKIENRDTLIDEELKLGLITKQEAISAHLTSSKIQSDLVDAKASMYDLHQRSLDSLNAASTLNGSADNLMAMDKVVKKAELEELILQLKSDIFSLTITADQLTKTIDEKNQVLSILTNSPYIQATKNPTTVAFVPYRNLKRVKVGAPVYSCMLDMILCYKSGTVANVYKAEEYSKHPIFKSDLKGQLIGIAFDEESDGQKKLLFINSKPLLF